MTAESQNSEKIEAAIYMQWHCKHIHVEMNIHTAREESFKIVFSMCFMPGLYSTRESIVTSTALLVQI
jgi:hypothetical protein